MLLKVWNIVKLGVPAIISIGMFFLQEMTNIYFVSHLEDKSFVSAVGLGNLIMNSMVIGLVKKETNMSLNSLMESYQLVI